VAAPESKPASAEDAGRVCPYCRFALKEGAETTVCGVCKAPHHVDCWNDNGGCAVMACAGGPSATPATRASQPTAPTAVAPGAPAPPIAPPPPRQPRRFGGPSLSLAILVLAVAVLGVAGALILTRGSSPTPKVGTNHTKPGSTSPTGPTTGLSTAPTGPTTGLSTGPTGPTTVRVASPRAPGPGTAFRNYWQLINEGDYQQAFDMESADEQGRDASLVSDSEVGDPVTVVSYVGTPQYNSDGTADISVSFYSRYQNGGAPGGTACGFFQGTEVMVKDSGRWLYGSPSYTRSIVPQSDC
jgi:hypothetical protein